MNRMKMKTEILPAEGEAIAKAADLLRRGELVALPTETVYGIAADARNGAAVAKIFVAKGRPQDNPLIVHVTGPEMLPGLVSEVPERAQLLMAAFCPGPLTIIMPRGPEVAAECCAGLDTVGIRMPSHPVARAVIAQSGCAFAAPSANLSGKPSPTNAQDVFTDMDGRLPLILDGGECDVGVESTVISVVGEKPTLFRPGHITLEDLERALGEEVEVSKAILEKLPEGAVVRSPGMKYKHYAPKADVTLLDGTFEQFKAYVDAHADQNPSCLCFTGEAEKLGWPCVEYGREGDGADQAKHIFRSLRALDEQGDGVVYARCPEKGRPVHGGVQPPDPCGSVPGDPAMITLGITGRSGCGKSTVTAVFAAHGVPLVDADQISREILLPGSPLLPVLAQRFGADILYADGSLNRRLLADRAFAAPEGKAALDSLVLPEIIRRVCRLKQAAREAGAPLFVIDGAVIVGTDAEKECDHLCVVTAPFATSVARIAARDGIAPEMAARRLNAQTPEEVLLARADLVLRNDADLASLEAAAAALCEQLQAEGTRKGGADTSL